MAHLLAKHGAQIDAANTIIALLDAARGAVAILLRRVSDTPHRDKTLAVITRYFEAIVEAPQPTSVEKLVRLKVFCREIVAIVIAERPLIAARAQAAEAAKGSALDPNRRLVDTSPETLAGQKPKRMDEIGTLAEEGIGSNLAHEVITERAERIVNRDDELIIPATDQTVVVEAPLGPPYVCTGFDDLFSEAMCYQVSRATRFFQRSNPNVQRRLTRPFLLAPAFGHRLEAVVRDIIVPMMRKATRNIDVIANSRQWSGTNVVEFWEFVEASERFLTPIQGAWKAAWDQCRQRKRDRPGADGKAVLVADPILRDIRRQLAPAPSEYTIPTLRNAEIDILWGLGFDFDPDEMDRHWGRLRQLYEQEMDTRVYQDKARDGALRDSILHAFDKLPEKVGEFIVMLSYFCFPNMDLYFLDRLTHNKGLTVESRRKAIPYLMQFLEAPDIASVMEQENRERHLRLDKARKGKKPR